MNTNTEAIRHMVHYIGWLISRGDYELDPNVKASVNRWVALHASEAEMKA